MKKKSKIISFHPLSNNHILLAREYAAIMGYSCVINNKKRVAVIIDQNGNRGLLTLRENVLHYYWKGTFEKIEVSIEGKEKSDAERLGYNLKHLGHGMNAILGKIFNVKDIMDFKKRQNVS